MNDLEIKTLINSAVDAELGGQRTAPPFEPAALAERDRPAHPLRLWSAPLLAASVAVLLAVGAMLAITLNREPNHVGNPAGPAPSLSLSLSRSTNPDLEAANRAYAEAVAAAREATEVAGVSVGPVSAKDAAAYADSGSWSMPRAVPTRPEPGKSYSITIRYVVGPRPGTGGIAFGKEVSVVWGELRDVAAGSCPQPFLVRPAHTYLIHCQVTFRADTPGTAVFTDRNSTASNGATFYLPDPAMK